MIKAALIVLPMVGLLLALAITRATLADVKEERANLLAWRELTVAATRDAAASPRLRIVDVPAQIAALGRSVGKLSAGLDRCNSSARAAAENDARAQARAAEALKAAEQREAGRLALIDRLRASASRPTTTGSCEASKTVREIWK